MIGFEREDDEIVRYYQRVAPADMFGVWGTMLLIRLPLKKAEKLMMKPDHDWTEETWAKSMMKKDHDTVVGEIEDYFQFAWEKAVMHRGVSASRSIHHFLAWCWLLNDMELFGYLMDDRNYANYGCPMLLAVAQKYDLLEFLPSNPVDREVFLNMAQGRPCGMGNCSGGCGNGSPAQFRQMVIPLPAAQKKLILPK